MICFNWIKSLLKWKIKQILRNRFELDMECLRLIWEIIEENE